VGSYDSGALLRHCFDLGIWRVWVALGSAVLLILFGTAMAVSFGIKSPLDYSVFSASSAALLVAAYESRRKEWK